MNKLIFFILKKTFSTEKTLIINKKLPECINCLNFIGHINYPYHQIPSDTLYGKCKKFSKNDVITGLDEYDYAKHCRDDTNRCGKNGSEYIPIYHENNKTK